MNSRQFTKDSNTIADAIADTFSEIFCVTMYNKAILDAKTLNLTITECYKARTSTLSKIIRKDVDNEKKIKQKIEILSNISEKLNKSTRGLNGPSATAHVIALFILPEQFHSVKSNDLITKITYELIDKLIDQSIVFIYSDIFYLKHIIDNNDRQVVFSTFKQFIIETIEKHKNEKWMAILHSQNNPNSKASDNNKELLNDLHNKVKDLQAKLNSANTTINELKNSLESRNKETQQLVDIVRKLKGEKSILTEELKKVKPESGAIEYTNLFDNNEIKLDENDFKLDFSNDNVIKPLELDLF